MVILNFSGKHFEFFWQSFWIFIYLQSCGNKVVFAFWSEPHPLPLKITLNNLAVILNFSGGHFKFFCCRIFFYSQSWGNKVVFVFWSEPFSPLKITFKQSGGHFEFFFSQNLYLLTKLRKQSGLRFLSDPSKYSKSLWCKPTLVFRLLLSVELNNSILGRSRRG